jgi:site-specific recombinase XerD
MKPQSLYSKIETTLRADNRSDSTVSLYLHGVKRFISFCGDKELTEISTEDLEKFAKELFKNGKLKSGTLRTIKYGINYAFNVILNNQIDISVIPSPNTPRVKQEYFEKEELLRFFSNVQNVKHRTILELIYSAGMDIGDLSNIKVTDIKSDKKKILIRDDNGTIKREAYLSATILDQLRNYFIIYKPKKYLFEGKPIGEKISDRSLQTMFKKTLLVSGINKPLTTRSLKYSYVKHLTEDGIPLNSVLSHLNINNGETLKLYTDLCYPIKSFNSSPIDTLKLHYDDYEFFDTTDIEYILLKVKDKEERDYLLEGIKCFKANALRAGVIFLWTAAVYKIQKKCLTQSVGYINTELKKIYPKAKDIKVIEDFEYIKDEFLLDLACNIKVLDKTIKEELKNTCLDLRNKCGHPGKYKPKAQKIKAFVEDIIGMLY